MPEKKNLIRWLRPAAAFLALALLLATAGCQQLDDLRQRNTTTQKVTITTVPPEMQADANSSLPAISSDGRFVAFKSDATNLVIAKTSGASGIYVKDTETGETIRISTGSADEQANRDSDRPAISGNGRFVVFDSLATNLVPADKNESCLSAGGANVNCRDVFLKDIQTGALTLVSATAAGVQGDRDSSEAAISADGRYVAFKSSAANLVPGDANDTRDIFVRDSQTKALEIISVDAAGAQADDESVNASISADGRLVAFSSGATNLVPDDTNGKPDVFIKDRATGALTRVSTGAGGEQADDASGFLGLMLAPGGGFIAFESSATNLVPGDTNGKRDVFVKDLATGAIVRVSVDAAGQEGSEDSYGSISISSDGQWVAFRSDSPNLVPGDANAKADVFLRSVPGNTIGLISADPAGVAGNGVSERVSLSGDGRRAAFESDATNLITGDTNSKMDVFLRELATGQLTRASISTSDV